MKGKQMKTFLIGLSALLLSTRGPFKTVLRLELGMPSQQILEIDNDRIRIE
jgi:hypothetical protein